MNPMQSPNTEAREDHGGRGMSKYRILFVPAVEKSAVEAFTAPAETLCSARMMLCAIADYTLHLHEKGLMQDYSNFGMVEQFVDGEWGKVDDEGGE